MALCDGEFHIVPVWSSVILGALTALAAGYNAFGGDDRVERERTKKARTRRYLMKPLLTLLIGRRCSWPRHARRPAAASTGLA